MNQVNLVSQTQLLVQGCDQCRDVTHGAAGQRNLVELHCRIFVVKRFRLNHADTVIYIFWQQLDTNVVLLGLADIWWVIVMGWSNGLIGQMAVTKWRIIMEAKSCGGYRTEHTFVFYAVHERLLPG